MWETPSKTATASPRRSSDSTARRCRPLATIPGSVTRSGRRQSGATSSPSLAIAPRPCTTLVGAWKVNTSGAARTSGTDTLPAEDLLDEAFALELVEDALVDIVLRPRCLCFRIGLRQRRLEEALDARERRPRHVREDVLHVRVVGRPHLVERRLEEG